MTGELARAKLRAGHGHHHIVVVLMVKDAGFGDATGFDKARFFVAFAATEVITDIPQIDDMQIEEGIAIISHQADGFAAIAFAPVVGIADDNP